MRLTFFYSLRFEIVISYSLSFEIGKLPMTEKIIILWCDEIFIFIFWDEIESPLYPQHVSYWFKFPISRPMASHTWLLRHKTQCLLTMMHTSENWSEQNRLTPLPDAASCRYQIDVHRPTADLQVTRMADCKGSTYGNWDSKCWKDRPGTVCIMHDLFVAQ